ncbi:MAG TPA: glycosyltransferase family 39 protein [Polyangiaceae bacterium]|nr:glycosyltransferase family 39 protein [Polyangiaceae bacterium]
MPRHRLSWAIDACIALGALHFVAFVIVAIARLRYAFDVEWMEGGELLHAVRLLQGKPIYARPSSEFTAFFYTPLYPAAVAVLARAFGGVTYALGRGISLASTLATMSLLVAMVRREAGTRWALLALGTYAALDRFAGTFFDVARPDALALALAFASAVVVRRGSRDRSGAAAALLAVLAILTKQTMVILVAAEAAWLLARDRRRGVVFSALTVVLGTIAAFVLQRGSGGWFGFYVLSGHQSHAFYWSNVFFYFWRDLLFLAPLLLLLPLAWARGVAPRSTWVLLAAVHVTAVFAQRALTLDYPEHMYYRELAYESPRVLLLVPPLTIAGVLLWRRAPLEGPRSGDGYWLWMFAAALATSAVGHATQWAYKNAFLPAALFGALFVALAARDLARQGGAAEIAVAAVFAIQLVALFDSPASRMPTASDHAKLAALRERLARVDGRVLVLAHPLLAWEHDGHTDMHQMGLSDVALLGGVGDFEAQMARHAWTAVVTDDGDGLDVPEAVRRYYRREETLDGPWMKTGVRVHPAALWVPGP